MDRPIVSPRFASAGHDVSNLMTLRYTTDQYLLHTEANDVHQKIKLNSNDADDGGILRAGQNNNDEDPSMSSSESLESQQSVSKKGSDTMKIGSQSRVEQVKQFKTAELSPVDGGWTNMVWKRGSLRIMTYFLSTQKSLSFHS